MTTKEIPLYGGYIALVDEQDFEQLSQYRWHLARSGKNTYARTRIEGKHTQMHRLILPSPTDMVIDHVNGNGLDNRRANLRLATQRQNNAHRVRGKENAASKYIGVYLGRDGKSWRAQIVVNDNLIYLGLFRTQRDAATAYNKASLAYNGEFAALNNIPAHDPDDIPFPEPLVTSSGYHGVYAHGKRWQTQITAKGRQIHVGVFDTPEEAAQARDAYIVEHGLTNPLSRLSKQRKKATSRAVALKVALDETS